MDRRKFLNLVGCGCSGLMINACSTTPITDRRQFKIIPEAKLNAQAAQIYEKVKEKEKMSEDSKTLNEIKDIGKRMEDSISEYFYRAGLDDPTVNFDWEYILIDNNKVKNAWCMPGGKIAFYSGMLPIANNDDGIASIMGHEIAHAVARHSAERASIAMLADIGTKVFETFVIGQSLPGSKYLRKFGLDLPFSRSQETEADYLGLIFSSLAGYDIRESVKLWERMAEKNKGKEPPQFLSTHPSSASRIINLNNWVTEVIIKYPLIRKI